MDEFEKVEKLKNTAGVSYEDARDALRACNGDILDAIIYLENLGKTAGPKKSAYSTSYDEQDKYERVDEKVEEQRQKAREAKGSVKRMLKKICRFFLENSFTVEHKESKVFRLPLVILAIAFLIRWKLVLLVLVAALFFDCSYSFEGESDLSVLNDLCKKASELAQQVKHVFVK